MSSLGTSAVKESANAQFPLLEQQLRLLNANKVRGWEMDVRPIPVLTHCTRPQDKWLSVSLDERVAILEEMRLALWSPGLAQEVRASTNLSPCSLSRTASFPSLSVSCIRARGDVACTRRPTLRSKNHPRTDGVRLLPRQGLRPPRRQHGPARCRGVAHVRTSVSRHPGHSHP